MKSSDLESQNNIFSMSSAKPTQGNKKSTFSLSVFVDGASRGNPGRAGAGVYVEKNGKTCVFSGGIYLGKRTNNQAEYLALAYAAFLISKKIKSASKSQIKFVCDSELVVKQMTGKYKVKNAELARIKGLVEVLLEGFDFTFRHVLREKNSDADGLANEGIDSNVRAPKEFLNLLAKHKIS